MKMLTLLLPLLFVNQAQALNKVEGVGVLECFGPCEQGMLITRGKDFVSQPILAVGNVKTEDAGTLIQFEGLDVLVEPTPEICAGYEISGVNCPESIPAIKVLSYESLSNVGNTHGFLVSKGGEWTASNFPCLMSDSVSTGTKGNKTFSWDTFEENGKLAVLLKVRMTDTLGLFPNRGQYPQPFYELTYHGKTGAFMSVAYGPGDFTPSCSK